MEILEIVLGVLGKSDLSDEAKEKLLKEIHKIAFEQKRSVPQDEIMKMAGA